LTASWFGVNFLLVFFNNDPWRFRMSTSDNTKGWVILIALGLGIAFGVGPFKHAACSSHKDFSPHEESDEPATTTEHPSAGPSFGGGTLRTYKCSNSRCFCKKYEPKGSWTTDCMCGDPKSWHYEFME
jgi:hypothetical protein